MNLLRCVVSALVFIAGHVFLLLPPAMAHISFFTSDTLVDAKTNRSLHWIRNREISCSSQSATANGESQTTTRPVNAHRLLMLAGNCDQPQLFNAQPLLEPAVRHAISQQSDDLLLPRKTILSGLKAVVYGVSGCLLIFAFTYWWQRDEQFQRAKYHILHSQKRSSIDRIPKALAGDSFSRPTLRS